MTSEEFWKGDPQLFVSYRTSFINKKKREMEELDYKCWLQGVYVHDGNSKILKKFMVYFNNILSGIFKGQKDTSVVETYPERPYFELQREKQMVENTKKQKYKEFENSLLYFGTLKQQYLEKMKKKGE